MNNAESSLKSLSKVFAKLNVKLKSEGINILNVISYGKTTDKISFAIINENKEVDLTQLISIYPGRFGKVLNMLKPRDFTNNYTQPNEIMMGDFFKDAYLPENMLSYKPYLSEEKEVVIGIHAWLIDSWSESSKKGIDIYPVIEELFLDKITTYVDKYMEIGAKIFKNLYVTFWNYLRAEFNVNYGLSDAKDIVGLRIFGRRNMDMVLIFNIIDILACEMSDKIINRNQPIEEDVIKRIERILSSMRQKDLYDKVAFIATSVKGLYDFNISSLSEIILGIFYMNTFKKSFTDLEKTLSERDVFLITPGLGDNSTVFKALRDRCSNKVTESVEAGVIDDINLSYDIDDAIDNMYDVELNGNPSLLAESKGRQWYRISNLASELSQIKVEEEFMDDKYSKKAVMDRAHKLLKKIDDLSDTLLDPLDVENIELLRKQVVELINNSEARNVKKERDYRFKYPLGYEG